MRTIVIAKWREDISWITFLRKCNIVVVDIEKASRFQLDAMSVETFIDFNQNNHIPNIILPKAPHFAKS